MAALFLDTHAALWYLADAPELSSNASAAIDSAIEEKSPVYVSAISLAEAMYLSEKGRITKSDYERLLAVLSEADSELTVVPFSIEHVAMMSKVPCAIVPDMPDRLIAATALYFSVQLVTRDRMIKALPGLDTIW